LFSSHPKSERDSEGKDTGEVNKKGKYKQEKSKLQEAKGSK